MQHQNQATAARSRLCPGKPPSSRTLNSTCPGALAALLGLTLLASGPVAVAGSWSTAAWTSDATTGISTNGTLWAYHFGAPTTATVNGVKVPGVAGGNPAVAGKFAITGVPSVFNGDVNNLTALGGGGSGEVAQNLIYGGFPASVSIAGLIPGHTYAVSFLSAGWEAGPGFRTVAFTSGTNSLVVDQDQFGDNHGIRVEYSFTATAATQSFTVAVTNGNNATWHFYALTLALPQHPIVVDSVEVHADFDVAFGDPAEQLSFSNTKTGTTSLDATVHPLSEVGWPISNEPGYDLQGWGTADVQDSSRSV